ncbi:RNA-directed DNA polymerase, eukaryota, reverse transcriptase zinc-binding domain protein [Tanacetum coccineum]
MVVCSRVFRLWEWTSNANLCSHACRIIMGWNVDVVHLMVISQSSQALLEKVFHKATSKTIFYSFIYAGNMQSERRILWSELGIQKNVVRGLPWILIGDFNVALNMEDIYAGSSSLNSSMCEFKECVAHIDVMDIN